MGIFGKKKPGYWNVDDNLGTNRDGDTHRHGNEEYKPPTFDVSRKFIVEVDKEYDQDLIVDKVAQRKEHGAEIEDKYSSANIDFANVGSFDNKVGGIPSVSSNGGRGPAKDTQDGKYQPIRYEPAKPPQVASRKSLPVALPLPATSMSSMNEREPIPPSLLTTSKPVSPRHKCSAPSTMPLSPPLPPFSIASTEAAAQKGCSCLEIGNYEQQEHTVPELKPSKATLSPFSWRVSTLSDRVRSSSTRKWRHHCETSNRTDSRNREIPILLDKPQEDDDISTWSTEGGTKDSCSIENLSQDGRYSLVTPNEFAKKELKRWTRASRVGNPLLRITAILLSLSTITMLIYLLVWQEGLWSIATVVCSVYTILSCILVLILEMRNGQDFQNDSPGSTLDSLAHLRSMVVRHMNLMELLWGRGCLYMFAATMTLTVDHIAMRLAGLWWLIIGILASLSGVHASTKLDILSTSFANSSFLEEKFLDKDSDMDGMIDLKEFSNLLASLGVDLGESKTIELFEEIDTEKEKKVKLRQFKRWWRRKQSNDEYDRHRMPKFRNFEKATLPPVYLAI